MPRSIVGVDAFMRDPANKNRHQGGGWHNMCEQFVNNAGDFGQDFDTALAAGNASGWLDPDISNITDGSIGYWSGVWIDGEECGHVAFWYQGAWLMASDAVTEMIGNGTGRISHAAYKRLRPAAIWRGHTKRHGTETLSGSTTATATSNATVLPTPVNPARRRGVDMAVKYYRRFDGKIGHFAAGVRTFGSREDYVTHRESVQEYAKLNPTEDVVIPPNENNPKNFVTLDQRHWDIEVALAGGEF